jgi:hypothetical protein
MAAVAERQTIAEYAVNFCSSPFAAAMITVTTVRSCGFAVGRFHDVSDSSVVLPRFGGHTKIKAGLPPVR